MTSEPLAVPVPGPGTPGPATALPGTTWFAAGGGSSGRARAHVATVLRSWEVDHDTVDDAVLLVSELAGNVVAHTDSRSVGVEVTAATDRVVVTVREQRFRDLTGDRPLIPVQLDRPAPPDAQNGRGLRILDALATEWGVSRAHRTTSTWFSLTPRRRLPLRALDPASDARMAALEAALERSGLLLRITQGMAAAADARAVGTVITGELRAHLQAVYVGIALLGRDGDSLRYLSLDPAPAGRLLGLGLPRDDSTPAGAVAGRGVALFHASARDVEREFPGAAAPLAAVGAGAVAHLPLTAGGTTFGTLAVGFDRPHEVDADTRELLAIVAGYAAQAVRRAPGALHPAHRTAPEPVEWPRLGIVR